MEHNQHPIILTVSNDLETDQRLHKVCRSLQKNGYKVLLVGRKLPTSSNFQPSFPIKRLNILFNKGALFYAFLNIQLFLFLILKKSYGFVANDLDTLPAVKLAAWIKRKPILVDLHELFTEVPEVVIRPKIQQIWLKIEQLFLPSSPHIITVCQSIATYYKKKYNLDLSVVRNIPEKLALSEEKTVQQKKTLIYQGAINYGRGIELMIDSMEFLPDYTLWIIGTGDLYEDLKEKIRKKSFKDSITLFGRKSPSELKKITPKASLGLSLEENIGLNYYYALPNKLFDYLAAEIPVLVSPFPEMKRLVEQYDTGYILDDRSPKKLAQQIIEIHTNEDQYFEKKKNCKKAAIELTWEKEFETYLDKIHKWNKQ